LRGRYKLISGALQHTSVQRNPAPVISLPRFSRQSPVHRNLEWWYWNRFWEQSSKATNNCDADTRQM